MCDGVVLVERVDGFHVITLNRPDRLNAFNDAQHHALRKALDDAGGDENCRAVMLTGAGRGFCAGQDLGDRDPSRMSEPPDLGDTLEQFYNPLVRQIRQLDKPVLAVVNGVAAGAGANIALACDLVLAARSAKFIQSFCKVGLIPDSGGSWSLTHLVGEARAKALALLGQPLSAEEAVSWGLIWRAVDDDALAEEAHSVMEGLAKAPTHGLALTKRAIHAAHSNSLDAHLDLERDLQREAGRTADYAEGVSAFLNKRTPKFSGKKEMP